MSKILIAFSCGPDSVYLYHYLKKSGHNLAICYVNHNLRYDVEEDEAFVKEFAKKENINYYITSIELDNFSENLAREKRYEILEKVRSENGYEYIATGHNKNDNVETIIFRLLRGTGIDGLKGIKEKNGKIIRPILNYSKEEILNFLEVNKIPYRIDYTNLTNDYSRNIIRNEVFPIFKKINSNFIDNISKFINLLNDENEIKQSIKEVLEKKGIKYSNSKINEIYNIREKNGTSIKLNNQYIWYKSYNYFGIKEIKNISKLEKEIFLGDKLYFNNYEIIFLPSESIKIYLEKKEYNIYNVGDIKKIYVRNRREGDKLDNTKIKKILIDKKIDRLKREELPIFLSEDKIILIANIKHSKYITNKLDNSSNYLVVKER